MADSSVASQHVYADNRIEGAPLPEAHPFSVAAPSHDRTQSSPSRPGEPHMRLALYPTPTSTAAPANPPSTGPSSFVVRPAPDREGLQSRGKQYWNLARDELVLRGMVQGSTAQRTTRLKWDAVLRRVMDPSRWHLVEIKLPDTYAQFLKEYNKGAQQDATKRKASLRSMVYTLRQRKRLHPKEVELLERMSAELRQLDHPFAQASRN